MNANDLEKIARTAHMVNRAYCESLGDYSQWDWEISPSWLKKDTVDGVARIIQSPDITSDVAHQQWMDIKIKNGWSYGPIKNPGNKEHPFILSYLHLPKRQLVKDHLFRTVVIYTRDILRDV